MSKVRVSVLLAAVGLILVSAGSEVSARQSHGGGGGGRSGGASFSAHSGGGGARFAASAAGFSVGARAAHISAPRASFSAGNTSAHVNRFVGARPVAHRRHRHGAFFVGFAPSAYGYVTRSYDHCAWLRVRYEETGLRKWRLRYEACRDGDDD
jgi:hypothetical protein